MKNISQFVKALRDRNDLVEIEAEVDAHLELAEIHRRVIEQNGKALLFKNVKGSPFPVATNLFGNVNRIELAFGQKPEQFVSKVAHFAHEIMPPTFGKLWQARHLAKDALRVGLKKQSAAPVLECKAELKPGQGLDLLPALVQWPEDGGRFVTLPLVYTEHPESKKMNLGMYRIHIYDEKTTGMHIQIERGGGFHYHVAESKNEALPVSLFIGGPPALILSAIAPLPEDIPELLLTSLLLGEKLGRNHVPSLPHPVISECEFAIIGKVPPKKRRLEGPFGDHYGYYSLAHEYPVFEVEHMYHRKNAIYPATVVGKPRQEDFFIGDYLQKLLSPLFPLVMPSVRELRSYGETGFHGLAAARVRERYGREAMKTAFRIFGEGQLSLQKFLMVTDGNVDLSDFKALLMHFLERTHWEKDLFIISELSMDTLDYTGPEVNKGSKGIWLATGDAVRSLHSEMPTDLPTGIRDARVFVPGCLVIEVPSFESDAKYVENICAHSAFQNFQLVIAVDDVSEATHNVEKFLWCWFTRFEPAADIYSSKMHVKRFHTVFKAPMFFDSRMKPWYPRVVEPLPETVKLVDSRWSTYFGSQNWR